MAKNIKKAEEAAKGIINVITGVAGKLEKNSPDNPFKVSTTKPVVTVVEKTVNLKPIKLKSISLNEDKVAKSTKEKKTALTDDHIRNAEDYHFGIFYKPSNKAIWKDLDSIKSHNIDIYKQKHFPVKTNSKGELAITHKGDFVANRTPFRFASDTKSNPVNTNKTDLTHTQLQKIMAKDLTARLFMKLDSIDPEKGKMFMSMYKDWDGPLYDLYSNIKNMPAVPKINPTK